jgi:Flp pilus assembly protein TadB
MEEAMARAQEEIEAIVRGEFSAVMNRLHAGEPAKLKTG